MVSPERPGAPGNPFLPARAPEALRPRVHDAAVQARELVARPAVDVGARGAAALEAPGVETLAQRAEPGPVPELVEVEVGIEEVGARLLAVGAAQDRAVGAHLELEEGIRAA